MNQPTVSPFHVPVSQPALGGDVGLNSEQIADDLGVRHDNIVRAIREYVEADPAFPHCEEKVMTGGRPKTIIVVPLIEARVIAAQYRSKIGIAYVRYLIDFERRAREAEPKLRAAFAALEEEVAGLRARLEATARPHAVAAPKTTLVTQLLTRHDSMMGDGEVVQRHLVRVQRDKLTDIEIKKAKRVMLILQQRGIANAIERISNEIDFAEQSPAQRIALAPAVGGQHT